MINDHKSNAPVSLTSSSNSEGDESYAVIDHRGQMWCGGWVKVTNTRTYLFKWERIPTLPDNEIENETDDVLPQQV